MTPIKLKKVIVVCGPTASGKSRLACDLALQFNGEIVNVDSRQLYKELSIGVDKPSLAVRRQIPHHLYDMISINDYFNVSQYVSLADIAVEDIMARGKIPILAGGTGLYIRAFLFGLFDTAPVDANIRLGLKERQKQQGLAALYEDLKIKDPQAALRIHPHDSVRLLRALEIFESTGKTISDWQGNHGFHTARYEYVKVAYSLPRQTLYERINARVMDMMATGLQNEVEALYKAYPDNEVILKTIGYAQWLDFFKGLQNLDRTLELIGQASRKFAKRQMTWFNKEADINWYAPDEFNKILSLIKSFLL